MNFLPGICYSMGGGKRECAGTVLPAGRAQVAGWPPLVQTVMELQLETHYTLPMLAFVLFVAALCCKGMVNGNTLRRNSYEPRQSYAIFFISLSMLIQFTALMLATFVRRGLEASVVGTATTVEAGGVMLRLMITLLVLTTLFFVALQRHSWKAYARREDEDPYTGFPRHRTTEKRSRRTSPRSMRRSMRADSSRASDR